LPRNDPVFYANNHIDQSWQEVVRRRRDLGKRVFYYRLEADGDGIDSNNLGKHARNQEAGYLDLDLNSATKWSLSAGLPEEILSGGARSVWSPDLAGGLRVSQTIKLRVSGGYGFRLPTSLKRSQGKRPLSPQLAGLAQREAFDPCSSRAGEDLSPHPLADPRQLG
jgi:hypothetical protein